MSKSVIFAYGSETGMGASIIEEAYAVAAETITDFDLALPEELGKGAYFSINSLLWYRISLFSDNLDSLHI